jgi:OCT family organic cation transporter-like MFS transporter 4/5
LIGSNLFFGWTLAAFVLPRLADIYGRRLVFMSAILLQTLCFAGLYITSNLYVAYVLMFFFGAAAVGRCSISYLYLMELLPKSRQVLTGTILSMNNQLTGLIGCLYFWQISKDWHWLELWACGSGIVSMIGVYFLPESPKFLVSLKKYDQARQAINTIARINKHQEAFDCQFDREVEDLRENIDLNNLKEISDTSATGLSPAKAGINEEKQLDGSLKDLLKIRRHANNLILMVFFWIASSFGFFLVNYTIKKIAGDFFNNNLVSALAAIPTTALGGFLYDRLGVKRVFMTFFSIAVVGGIALIIFSESQPALVPIMVAFAKGGVQATLETCYLANSFLFPAIFAGTAFGICNAGAKIATMVAPVLAEFTPPGPMIVFSIFAALGAVLPIFLKTEARK